MSQDERWREMDALRARLAAAEAREARLREEMRQIARTCEMSAGIMRDPKRTGGWEGAERVANSYERLSIKAIAALTTDGLALAAAIDRLLDAKTLPDRMAAYEAIRAAWRGA